ncbi:hypothetical protein Gogos_012644, partial [Gossypium gossypioides]|nr:hypothetical protein [Gossypium gossypioides]
MEIYSLFGTLMERLLLNTSSKPQRILMSNVALERVVMAVFT